MGQRVRHVGRIAHNTHMRAAVAEADQGVRVFQHLVHRAHIAVSIIGHWVVENGAAVILHHQVIGQRGRVDPAPLGLSADTG